MEGEFSGLGAERIAFSTDDITNVKRFENDEGILAYFIFFDLQLKPSLAILELNKSGFAKRSAGEYTTGNAYAGICGVQVFHRAVCGNYVFRRMLRLKIVGVRVYASFPERINLAASLKQEFA